MSEQNNDAAEVRTFEHLLVRARRATGETMLRAAIVTPHNEDVFVACRKAIDAGLIVPVMIGDKRKTAEADAKAGQNFGAVELVEAASDQEAIRTAIRMATSGEVDIIVRGAVPVRDFLPALVDDGTGFVPKGAVAGLIGVMKPEKYEKLLAITDCGIIPEPNLKQKIALTQNLIVACTKFGIENPRVAVIAAVEVVYPQMPVTVDAAVLSKMNERGQIKGGEVDGPLSFDCAIDPVAARSKGITRSEVAGRADAMVAPNTETAHGVYTAMALYGNAQVGAIVYGGRCPVACPRRAGSTDAMFNSIVLAVLCR